MSDFKQDQEAQAALKKTAKLREDVRRAALNLPPELQGLLPLEPGDPGNKLPLSLHGVDNDVLLQEVLYSDTVPNGREITVQLLWDNAPSGPVQTLVTPIDPNSDLPVTMLLPALYTASAGRFMLSYQTVYAFNPTKGPEVEIIIDKEAPNHDLPGPPLDLPDIAGNIIDKQYFDNNATVTVEIARPTDRATGDIAIIYFGRSIPGNEVGRVTATDNSPAPLTYDVSTFDVLTGGEGQMIFYYRWEDRVGNLGDNSHPLDVIVLLSDAPTNLLPPHVPAAVGPNNTVNVAASQPYLAVRIPPYTGVEVNVDKVVLTFGDRPPLEKTVTGTGSTLIEVPYSYVRFGGVGPRNVDLSYVIQRYTSVFPELIGETIEVDLTRPGPTFPDPEDPDIGNPNLTTVVVQGTGTPQSPDDTLELVDAGLDADASAVIYDNFQADDEVQLFWDSRPVPGGLYTVTGTETPGDLMTFVIPWATIDATSNGIWPVHYEVTGPTTANPNPSLRTEVDVHVAVTTLPDPVIQNVQNNGTSDFLVCSSLENVSGVGRTAVVHVNGGGPLTDGLVLNFTWSGSNPDGPVPDFPFSKTLTGGEHINGFDVYLPLTTALVPILDGSGSIIYEANIAGRPEASNRHDVEVVVVGSDGQVCPANVTRRK
ncbi:hypothetical protein HX882_31925 [Pseudomonas gingeri]|uniref:Uncharacterized protein n=1 Tax=Pseudomonas gingeri TaxID=117681 RepID=A0A7Y7XIJ9_9PSED|nr:hypothetical protein [Pseudomonas gingeri]NWC00493.1 hypothetical protein [Pseudomonas gingeri]